MFSLRVFFCVFLRHIFHNLIFIYIFRIDNAHSSILVPNIWKFKQNLALENFKSKIFKIENFKIKNSENNRPWLYFNLKISRDRFWMDLQISGTKMLERALTILKIYIKNECGKLASKNIKKITKKIIFHFKKIVNFSSLLVQLT